MEALSVAASIAGLLTVAREVGKLFAPYVFAAVNGEPHIAKQIDSEVASMRTILLALQGVVTNLSSVPARNASLVQIDHVVAVLMEGVLLFSEIESSIPASWASESDFPMKLNRRLWWARKEKHFGGLLARLQGFKLSLNAVLAILNW